jgi:hypothetical protein
MDIPVSPAMFMNSAPTAGTSASSRNRFLREVSTFTGSQRHYRLDDDVSILVKRQFVKTVLQ